MRVISRAKLREFWLKYPDCEQQLKSWFKEVQHADWQNVNELKIDYPTVSIVGNNRYVFNIKGKQYRLIVLIRFEFQVVFIRFVGTNTQYDKVNAKNI